jgi:hypothetical protein
LIAASQGGDFLSSLDHFYYHQRVKNFIGNGLKLYGQFGKVVAPMADPHWVAVAKSMPRRLKLGSRWHRHAIAKLCPELLAFPEQATGRPMALDPGFVYRKKSVGKGSHMRITPTGSVLLLSGTWSWTERTRSAG